METKLSMRTLLNTRRDAYAVLSCYTVADVMETDDGEQYFNYVPTQSEQQIQGAATKLQEAFRLYPESYYYGTAAVRASIVKHSGIKDNSSYKKRRSVAIWLIEQISKWLGKGTGKADKVSAIDIDENRILRGWSGLDAHYQNSTIKKLNADNSLIALESRDTKGYFVPHFPTIYPHHTSTLKDMITAIACCNGEYIGALAWRHFVSVSGMGPEKRKEVVGDFIVDRLTETWGDRFKFRTIVDPDGVSDGPFESIFLEVYSNKARISNTFTIETHRMSDAG